jgi:hypothetical protein
MDLDNKLLFAFKEPSNQVTKKFAFREKERKRSKLCLEYVGQWSPS